MPDRAERILTIDGRTIRACEAWRGRGGHGLCYLHPVEGKGDGTEDRRALLGPGESLSELPDDRLTQLYRNGARLTRTERRFQAPDGREWLVQSTGPVWTEGVAAAWLGELLFTSLEGPFERFSVPDGDAGRTDETSLAVVWSRGRGRAGE